MKCAFSLLIGTLNAVSLGESHLYSDLNSCKSRAQAVRTSPVHWSSKFYKFRIKINN